MGTDHGKPPFEGEVFDPDDHATGSLDNPPVPYEGPIDPVPVSVVTRDAPLPVIYDWAGVVTFTQALGPNTVAPRLLVAASNHDRMIRRLTFAAATDVPGTAATTMLTARFAITDPATAAAPTMEPRTLIAASYWPLAADQQTWCDNDVPDVPYLLRKGQALYVDLAWYVRAAIAPVPALTVMFKAELS